MMTASRNNEDWAVLVQEYSVCKKKLESKREALRILVKQQEQTQIANDVLQKTITQLEEELGKFKALLGNNWSKNEKGELQLTHREESAKIKTLNNLLQFSRQENQKLQNDFQSLKQLYNESQRDNQLLRNSLTKQEERKKYGATEKEGKELLIAQLEEANGKVGVLDEELKMLQDDKRELVAERDALQHKNVRLNNELNYILHNDDKRIVDVDSLVLENQYLKEVIVQYKEEKNVALSMASRCRDAMKQQTGMSHSLTNDVNNNGITSQKEGGIFAKRSANHNMILELQRVNKQLTEKVSEKETALKHQRNTNRVLGTRVSELEKKLKTLEISGLWSHEQRRPRNLGNDDVMDSHNNNDGNGPVMAFSDLSVSVSGVAGEGERGGLDNEHVLSDDSSVGSPVHTANGRPPEGLLIEDIHEDDDRDDDDDGGGGGGGGGVGGGGGGDGSGGGDGGISDSKQDVTEVLSKTVVYN